MKKIFFILFAITLLVLNFSCNKNNQSENNQGGENQGTTEQLENPIVKLDKSYYVIGEEIKFEIENYDNLDDFNITFNTDNGVKVNNGVVTARRAGEYTATITHKEDSTKQATVDFKIYLKFWTAYIVRLRVRLSTQRFYQNSFELLL